MMPSDAFERETSICMIDPVDTIAFLESRVTETMCLGGRRAGLA
jgi:hypothetical protein